MGEGASRRGNDGPRKFHQALTEQLLAFAQHAFSLGEKLPDGATKREHYEAVERASGNRPEPLLLADDEPCPEELVYLWEIFCTSGLRRQRDPRGFPIAISSAELKAWCSLHGVFLVGFEADMLAALEQAYVLHEYGVVNARLQRQVAKASK